MNIELYYIIYVHTCWFILTVLLSELIVIKSQLLVFSYIIHIYYLFIYLTIY